MFQSHLPKPYWSYAIKHAVYLINRTPFPIIDNKTPFEILHKHNPDFSILKVFGCLSYASTNLPRQKFDVRAKRGVFLGYQTGTKGYLILDLNNKDIFVSRNVLFNEKVFPFTKINSPPQPINTQPITFSQPTPLDNSRFDYIRPNFQPTNNQPLPSSHTSPLASLPSPHSPLSHTQPSPSSAQDSSHSSPLPNHSVAPIARIFPLLTSLTMSVTLVRVMQSLLQPHPTNLLQRYLILFMTLLIILVFPFLFSLSHEFVI